MTAGARHVVEGLLSAAILAALAVLPAGCEASPYAASTPGTVGRWEPARGAAPEAASAAGPVDELWVVARPNDVEAAPPADQQTPGSGALMTTLPGQSKPVPVPLRHTEVTARIDAYIATVNVRQQFHNPFDSKIEAVYVFPLPQDAAVNEFVMTIGDRRIRGIIREREQAEQIYLEARAQGYVASLMTQERPSVFTQKGANIEPGRQIDVDIRYFHTLAYDDGWYEFVFPMVVGPRYNPRGYTDGIGAAAHGSAGATGQPTEVPYLKPAQRSGHDIGLTVDIDAGVSIEALRSVNHRVTQSPVDATRTRIALDPDDTLPNKDFVLRFQVAGQRIKTNVLTHRDERGGFFALVLYPPKQLQDVERTPMEMIFVLDCSGSMNGAPIEQAKAAAVAAIRQLQPYDTFQVIRFSNDASQFGPDPVPATEAMKHKAVRYVRDLAGQGGTEMIEGVRAALDFPHSPERLRFVSFMTDGYIGNDREIVAAVHDRLGASRIFSFGVGSAPNRYLLNRMAKVGRGAVAYLSLNDNGEQVMDGFFRRISHPALTDITLDFGDAQISDVYPRRIPDLFVGRPVVITGRYRGAFTDRVRVTGRAGERALHMDLPVADADAHATPALASLWARAKIADLYDRSTWDGAGDLADEIRRTALEFQLLSDYTAFVAVDSLTRTAGSVGTSVGVPVPVPEGTRYDTTVTE